MKSNIDILFIQPKNLKMEYLKLEGNELPLGLLYLSSFVEKKGFTSEVLDFNIFNYNLNEVLRKTRPKVVAITAITPEIINANQIAKAVKEFDKNIVTLIGGAHVSALPSQTLKDYPSFDYAVCGEGEQVVANFLEALRKGNKNNVKGLWYKKGRNIKKNQPQKEIENLDDIPFPARHNVNMEKYIPLPGNYKRLPSTAIITSRGCPYNCRFCNKVVFSRKTRLRSADNVLKEIKYCIDSYGISDFRFVDDTLTLNKKRIKKICKDIIKEKQDISWNCYSRVDTIDYDLLKLMKKAGCYHIKYGVESGSPRVLELMNKKINLAQAKKTIKLTKRAGIESKVMFMFGVPGETRDDMLKTLKYAKQLSADITTFLIFVPFPGSEFYNQLNKKGLIKDVSWDDYSEHSKYIIDSHINQEEIDDIFKKAYRELYFNKDYISQRLLRLLKDPKREIKFVFQGLKILSPLVRQK